MAAKRVFRSALDWNKFAEVVPKDNVSEGTYKMLKSASDSWTSKVNAFPEKLPTIDWNFYKTRLPALASTINEFEQKYKALQVAYPKEPSDIMNAIVKAEQDYQVTVRNLKTDVTEKEKAIKAELAKLAALPPIDQMTTEDWLDYFPEYVYDPRIRPSVNTLGPEGGMMDAYNDDVKAHENYGLPIPEHH